MIYIWELENCFVKEIVAKFGANRFSPLYDRSLIHSKESERKGYVTPRRVGNTYQYTPAIRESEYKRSFMSGVVM